MISDRKKTLALLTVPLMLAIITVLMISDSSIVFEPPHLLGLLNTLFVFLVPLSIAFITYRTYLAGGSLPVLLFGAGVLMIGLGSFSAGWLLDLPGGENSALTVHNTSFCVSSILLFVSALLLIAGTGRVGQKVTLTIIIPAYGGVLLFVILLCVAAVQGILPAFFIFGVGPTVLRQVVLGTSIALFAVSALLFFAMYAGKREDFFFCLSVALGLTATGMLAILLQPAVGSLIGWAGRIAQYAGACCALSAVLTVQRDASISGIPIEERLGRSFSGDTATREILFAVKESIFLFGTDGIILMANPTAIERLGKSAGEVIGHHYSEFMAPELALNRQERLDEVIQTHGTVRFEDERDGIIFDHSFYPVTGSTGMVTGVLAFSRDITERRLAEKEALSAREKLGIALRGAKAGTWEWDIPTGKFTWSPEFFELFGLAPDTPASFETWLSMLHPDDRESAMARIDQSVLDHGVLWNEYRIILPDQTTRWIGEYGKTDCNGEGRPLSMSGICLDITERKAAGEELRIAQERTDAVIEEIADTFYSLDQNWRFTAANPAAEKAPFGRPAAELLGQVIWDLFPQLKIPDIYPHYTAALENQALETYEIESPLNGRWYEVFVQGREQGVDVYMRDIDDRRRAEEALKESEERYRIIADFSSDWVFWIDPEGEFLYISPSTGKILGRPVGIPSDIRHFLACVVHPDDLNMRLAHLDNEIENKTAGELEFRIVRPDGEVRWIHHTCRPVYDESGKFLGIRGSNQDITDRRRADEALRESEERFRVLVINTPDTMTEQDCSLRYTTVINPPLGMKDGEMLGRTDTELLSGEDAASLTGIKQNVLVSGQPLSVELTLRNRDGKKEYFQGSFLPRRDAEDHISGLIGYLRNVTESVETRERISLALKEKEMLIRELHHRVKNNLQVISGLLDMSRTRAGDETTKAVLTDMMMKVQTMAQIHTRLYESRQFDRVDMESHVRDQATAVSTLYSRDGHHITWEIKSAGLVLPVHKAIPCALAINEMLSNAFKHAFRGRRAGKIVITLEQENGMVRVSVRDNGVGMPANFDISRSKSLGMKLVRTLLEHQMNGSYQITNGHGTEVIIEFPLKTPMVPTPDTRQDG